MMDENYIQWLKSVAPRLEKLCTPLFEEFNFVYFAHRRTFHNSNLSFVFSNIFEALKLYYEKVPNLVISEKWLNDGDFYLIPDISTMQGRNLLPQNAIDFFSEARSKHHIGTSCVMVDKSKLWTDIFIFSINANSDPQTSFFITNSKILKHFIMYYREYGKELIAEACNHLITLNPAEDHDIHDNFLMQELLKKRQDFYKRTMISNYYLKNFRVDTYLTKRELDCIRGLTFGKSSKEIGRELNISYRTIESYIRNIKNKLGVNQKTDIINIILENDLLPLLER